MDTNHLASIFLVLINCVAMKCQDFFECSATRGFSSASQILITIDLKSVFGRHPPNYTQPICNWAWQTVIGSSKFEWPLYSEL